MRRLWSESANLMSLNKAFLKEAFGTGETIVVDGGTVLF